MDALLVLLVRCTQSRSKVRSGIQWHPVGVWPHPWLSVRQQERIPIRARHSTPSPLGRAQEYFKSCILYSQKLQTFAHKDGFPLAQDEVPFFFIFPPMTLINQYKQTFTLSHQQTRIIYSLVPINKQEVHSSNTQIVLLKFHSFLLKNFPSHIYRKKVCPLFSKQNNQIL